MSHEARAQARDEENVRVAVFDRRPLAADGIAALLTRTARVKVVGIETSIRAAVRLLDSTAIDTVVVGITAEDPVTTTRLIGTFPPEKLAAGPRIVGVVSGDQELADRLSGEHMTALTTESDPEALCEVVIGECSTGVVEIAPSIIRPIMEFDENVAQVHPPLTPREQEVLEGIRNGLSTKEIARDLGIAANTVRTHAQRLMSKLAVHSRLQAAAISAAGGHTAAGP